MKVAAQVFFMPPTVALQVPASQPAIPFALFLRGADTGRPLGAGSRLFQFDDLGVLGAARLAPTSLGSDPAGTSSSAPTSKSDRSVDPQIAGPALEAPEPTLNVVAVPSAPSDESSVRVRSDEPALPTPAFPPSNRQTGGLIAKKSSATRLPISSKQPALAATLSAAGEVQTPRTPTARSNETPERDRETPSLPTVRGVTAPDAPLAFVQGGEGRAHGVDAAQSAPLSRPSAGLARERAAPHSKAVVSARQTTGGSLESAESLTPGSPIARAQPTVTRAAATRPMEAPSADAAAPKAVAPRPPAQAAAGAGSQLATGPAARASITEPLFSSLSGISGGAPIRDAIATAEQTPLSTWGGAPWQRASAPKMMRSAGASPIASPRVLLTGYEALVQVAAATGGLDRGERVRLRKLTDDVASEFGVTVTEFLVDGEAIGPVKPSVRRSK